MVDVAQKLDEKGMPVNRPRVVRVLPRDERVARSKIRHPSTGAGFSKTDASRSAEWPMDKYTYRRIKDGTVTIESAPDASPEFQEYVQRLQARAKEYQASRQEQPAPEAPRRLQQRRAMHEPARPPE
jgi:hypothetical protein